MMYLTRVLFVVLSVSHLAVSLPVTDEITTGEISRDIKKSNQSVNDFNLNQSVDDLNSDQSVKDINSKQTILNLDYPENVISNISKNDVSYFEDIINTEIDDIISPIYPSQQETRPLEMDIINEVKVDTTYYDLYNNDDDDEIEDDQIDVGEILTAAENGVVFTPSLIFKRKQALKRKRRRNQATSNAVTSKPIKPTKPVKSVNPVQPVYVYYYYPSYYPYSSSYYRRYSYGDFDERNGVLFRVVN